VTAAHQPPPAARDSGRRLFIAGLGIGQIVLWGSLYYSFPLIAEPMGRELGVGKASVYGAATVSVLTASLAAYLVGAAIDRGHGRRIMTAGSFLSGLLLFAWSRVGDIEWLYLLHLGIGVAQAMSLYDACFAVVARRYGPEARHGITALTLWGGFAGTVFVPLIQVLVDHLGWRGALVALGCIDLALCVAIHLLAIDPRADAPRPAPPPSGGPSPLAGRRAVAWAMGQPTFWGLAIAFTVYSLTFSGFSFHLYPLLLERGLDAATVVAGIAVIGPAQVVGRGAVWLLARTRSIRTIGRVTVLALPVAMLLLLLLPPGFGSLALFAVVFGGANGIMTIVRGVAVHEMLTRDAYGAINGAMAVPSVAARAAAPVAVAAFWDYSGSYDAFLVLVVVGSLCVVAGFWYAASRREAGR